MLYFTRIRFLAALIAAVTATALSGPAQAQATRTWVSGVGDDVNPCSRTAPCKTFAGAISKTAAGGEINCLDPGGYGAVTITKSMTISCPYTEGGALAGGNGIVINDSATATPGTIVVYLRGLDIFGVSPPSNGVRFVSGAALHIEDSTIRRFNAANSFGVSFQPAGAALLFMHNVTVADNGNAGSGGGVLVQPTGTGSAKLVLTNVRIQDNANVGFRALTAVGGGAAGVVGSLNGVIVSRNGDGIQASAPAGAPPVTLMVANSDVSHNTVRGLFADGSSARMRVGQTSITGNATGVGAFNSASINTYGDNRNDGNVADGAFTLPIIAQE